MSDETWSTEGLEINGWRGTLPEFIRTLATTKERDSLKARVAELEVYIGTLMPQLAGVLAEREACAKVVEGFRLGEWEDRIAAAIRARGGP